MPPCASCGEENPAGARFCGSCGAPQAPATCPGCGEENPAKARFCLSCGAQLAAPPEAAPAPLPAARSEERKLDTLVFVDLVGSTALAESLDPEDVLSLLELYYTRLRAELERHGGTVEKYIGDAIATHFGVPVGHEDDPERAVRAALAILDTVVALNAEDPIRQIQVRIGINTGEVIVRHGNRAEEGTGLAWGDALNTAARIESAAPVMGILVGEETYRASRHAIEYSEHEPIEAKGKSDPVRVWEVVRVREVSTRGRAHDAPLVGRDAELGRLLALWEQVRAERHPAFAAVLGEPGVGKSRLVSEVTSRLTERGTVLWGRCLSYGEGITYWPVIEILEGAAGILKSDPQETVSAKLGTLLESLGTDDLDQLRTMASALANLVGVPRTPRGTYSATEISKAELHWGVRRVLELLADTRPLTVVFEDLHWAEPTLLELLDFLGEADAPILLIGSARPELATTRPALVTESAHRATVSLGALDNAASEALLAELAAVHGLPPGDYTEQLLRNAAGNPLFLEETVRMLAESGALAGGGAPVDIAVPTSLQAMIGARLDGLADEDKGVAQHASIVGMVFWSGAVAELHGGEAAPSLQELEGRDFVRAHADSSIANEHEWAFKHALIKDVAYGRVPKSRRASLHVRFVDWLGAHPAAGDEFVEIVAYHLEQSCKLAREVGRSEAPPTERAVDALMRAAAKAERREGIREADRYYARALELVGDEQSAQALEVRLGRAGTLQMLGDLKQGDELLAHVVAGAGEIGRPDLQGKALLERSNIATKQSRAAEALRHVLEADAIASRCGDRGLQVRTIYRAAYIRSWFHDAGPAAVPDMRRAVEIAEELEDRPLEIDVRTAVALVLYNVGDLAGAQAELERCFEVVGGVGALRDEARLSFLLALVRYHQGDLDDAERIALRAQDWLERTGDSYYQLQNLRTLSLCALARSDLDTAEQRLRRAIPLALEAGSILVDIYRILIDVLIRQERLADARELAVFAFRSVPEEDAYARAAGLLIEASIRTVERRRDVAEQSFEEALRLLEEQRLPLDLAEARLAYGRALRGFGDDTSAGQQLARARADLVRMGARGLLDEIDHELAVLSEGAGQPGPLASA